MRARVRYVITILHIICSFLWRGLIFKNVGVNPSGTIAISNAISDRTEIILTYILSELFACVLIFLFWKLAFHLLFNYKKQYTLFLIIFAVGGLCVLFAWPEAFAGPDYLSDNLVTFSCAVRLTPDYWHSAYTGIIYAAAMLMMPLSCSVTLVQWGFFVFLSAYIFERIGKSAGKLRYLVLLMYVFPNSPEIMTYSHRMCQYVIVLTLFCAMILFDLLNSEKVNAKRIILIALFGAFLSVWRTEGIIVGFIFFVMYAFLQTGKKAAKTIAYCGVFLLFFLLMRTPDQIGNRKYYGNDYKIINAFEPLKTILNAEEANLAYAGAEDDLTAIAEIVPIDVIKEYGVEGYRRINNGVNGYPDINQSRAPKEKSDAFLSSYKRVVLHNPLLFIKNQINTATTAAGIGRVFETQGYRGAHVDIPSWEYCGWTNGFNDLYTGNTVLAWRGIPLRARFANKFLRTRVAYTDLAKRTGVYAIGILVLFTMNIAVFVNGLINRKNRTICILGFASFAVLLEFAAILAVMPVAATIYFFSCSYLFALILYLELCRRYKKIF